MSAKIMIDSFKKKIQLNPFYLTGILYPLIDNENDSFIEDRTATPGNKIYTNPVRISTKNKNIKKTEADSTPYTFEEVFFMVSDNETVVDERLEFNYKENSFKITKRIPVRKYNDIIGYKYELKDITEKILYA